MLAVLALASATTLSVAAPADAAGAPNTIIKKGPSGTITTTTATFKFKAKPKTGATFKCRLDKGRFKKCTSPAKYTGLAQGAHTFAVQAKANGKKDKTPATRTFSVDTIAPTPTITDGPTGTTNDTTPTFTFTATGPATFTCAIDAGAFAACTSPFTPAAPLAEGAHTFTVRARDAAGNTASAARAFSVVTPITKDKPSMEAAAALWYPGSVSFDVPASCASNPRLDCPDGTTPIAPTDQVTISSARTVTATGDPNVYDLSVLAGVVSVPSTVVKVTVTSPFTITCDLTVDSGAGSTVGWTATSQLSFIEVNGETRIQSGDVTVSGVEAADLTVGGSDPNCPLVSAIKGTFVGQLQTLVETQLETYIDFVGNPLCADPGPAYLGPCP